MNRENARLFNQSRIPSYAVRLLLLIALGSISESVNAEPVTQEVVNESVVSVRKFGAIPDDGECDVAAINEAIRDAVANGVKVISFEAGTYNLRYKEGADLPTLLIQDASELTLRGAVDTAGAPMTTLELNLPLENEFGVRHLNARGGNDLVIENLIFDLNPRYSTSGKVIEVNREEGLVRVEIFPEMSHFEGMKCYSSNSWDLETRDLLLEDALTINMREPYFENLWQRVEDPDRIVYEIRNMPFVDTLNVGDGISWHFSARTTDGFTMAFHAIDGLVLRNLRIYNSITLSAKTYDCWDISIVDVRIEPVGNSLAVGPRDAIHISNPRGRLLVDGLYIKGVRWDPLVSRVNFVTVQKVDGNRLECTYTVSGDPDRLFQIGDRVDLWSGEKPLRMHIANKEVLSNTGEKRLILELDEEIPDYVKPGSLISPKTWDEAIIRNSVFEGNCGTPIVYENENLLVENNIFRNNTYTAIGIGSTSLNTGAFGSHIVIRGNLFIENGWISKYGKNHGMITTFHQHPAFRNEAYNSDILIEQNFFVNLDYNDEICGIHLRNARDVTIRNNHFINVPRPVLIDKASTENIVWTDSADE